MRGIIATVEGGAPLRRLILGSDAGRMMTESGSVRPAEVEAQRESATVADLPVG